VSALSLQERIAQLEDGLRDREGAAQLMRMDGGVVPMVLRRTIARLRHDLKLMQLVQAWADERRDWDPRTAVKFGGWTEAEAALLAAARDPWAGGDEWENDE
jgi:hypothetical protein